MSAYIPEPVPVKSAIEVTALYYPGTEQMAEWDQVEQTLPGIKPVLGWYDEGNPEVIDWQIKWAVEHGISSFCVDWYWNHGTQRLDHWVKGYYRARFRKYLKWYMMWANHNEAGAHSTADQIRVTNFWIDNYFKTPEYYTIDGKPVVVIWQIANLDNDFIAEAAKNGETLKPGEGVKRALELSDQMAKAAGLSGIYFVNMYQSWRVDEEIYRKAKLAGYQGQMMYNIGTSLKFFPQETWYPTDTEREFSYEHVLEVSPRWWEKTVDAFPEVPMWPIVSTGWNDIPRSFQKARIVAERTPERFGRLCRMCREFCERKGVKRIVIAPVNEWQEGSYIEPNAEYGFEMIDTMRDAFCDKPASGWPKNLTPQELGMGPYDYPKMEHLAKTSWDFSEDPQGWYRQPYGTGYIRNDNGKLRFFRTGADKAALRTRIAPFDASQFKTFKVRMRIQPTNPAPNGDEQAKIYWGTPEHPIFSKDFVISELCTAAVPVKIDGEWHDYALPVAGNPTWRGPVEELWFDPANLRFAWVEIEWMRFE